MQLSITRYINVFLIINYSFSFDDLTYNSYTTYLTNLNRVSDSFLEIIEFVYNNKIIMCELNTGDDKFINNIKVKSNDENKKIIAEIEKKKNVEQVKYEKKEYEIFYKKLEKGLKCIYQTFYIFYTYLYEKNKAMLDIFNIIEHGYIQENEEENEQENKQENEQVNEQEVFLGYINSTLVLLDKILKISISDALITVKYHLLKNKSDYVLNQMNQYLHKFINLQITCKNKLNDKIYDLSTKKSMKLSKTIDKVVTIFHKEKNNIEKNFRHMNKNLNNEIEFLLKIERCCVSLRKNIYCLHAFFLTCNHNVLIFMQNIITEDLQKDVNK